MNITEETSPEVLRELPERFEEFGMLSAPPQPTTGELKGWDSFNTTTAGTITGKVAPLGGTWSGAGDAVGFTVDTTNKWIKREEKSDADLYSGYYARLGTQSLANVSVSTSLTMPAVAGNKMLEGVFARYSSTSNWVAAVYERAVFPSPAYVRVSLLKRVAGVVTTIASSTQIPAAAGSWRSLELNVDSAGLATVFEGAVGGDLSRVITATDSALASGGALETGGIGIYDAHTGTEASERMYDDFSVTQANTPADAVIFASQKAQLTTQGMYRLDSGGSAYAPVSRVIGDLPRLPAGNLEGRSVELFLKVSPSDLEEVPDSSIPDLNVKIYASRSWLTVPGTI